MVKNHPTLGKPGEIVQVKNGYARNYLIPRKYAIAVTTGNLKQVEVIKQRQFTAEEKRKERMLKLAEKLSRISVDLVVEVDDEDRLFGSITTTQIADALAKQGYSVSKNLLLSPPAVRWNL